MGIPKPLFAIIPRCGQLSDSRAFAGFVFVGIKFRSEDRIREALENGWIWPISNSSFGSSAGKLSLRISVSAATISAFGLRGGIVGACDSIDAIPALLY